MGEGECGDGEEGEGVWLGDGGGGIHFGGSWCGVDLAEMGGEVDEVADADLVVVIEVAILPGGVGLAEVGGEVDEVGDGDGVVEVEVADEGGTEECFAAGEGGDWAEVGIERSAGGAVADGGEAEVGIGDAADDSAAGVEAVANLVGDGGEIGGADDEGVRSQI
jgi:hypothetical protein